MLSEHWSDEEIDGCTGTGKARVIECQHSISSKMRRQEADI